jgi:uncharacterized delta-60 repeat protein
MPVRLRLRLLAPLIALLSLLVLPSMASAVPQGTCSYATSKDLLCVLDISLTANSTVSSYGVNLDQVKGLVVTFEDGSSRTYYRPNEGTNAAGVTVDWGSAATIPQAMVDAANLPQGFKMKVQQILPGAGKKIVISDPSVGGLNVTSFKYYDTLPIDPKLKVNVNATPPAGGSWIPPTVSDVETNVDTLTIKSPGGLNTVTRINMTCSQLGVSGAACPTVLPSFNKPPTAQTAPNQVISWTDTQIVVKHTGFPGTLLSGFTMRNGTQTAAYAVSPNVLFSPRIDSVARTATPRQFQITGATFGRLSHLIVRLEDGTLRRVSKPSTATPSSTGITVNSWGEFSILVTDTALRGHSIENITYYYVAAGGTSVAVNETNLHLYFVGTISAIFSDAINSLTVSGEGLQAVTSLTIKFSDAVDYVVNLVENDGTFNELTITDDILGGKTVTGVVATTYDGQTMQLLGQSVTVAAPGPRFTISGPPAGQVGTGALVWTVNSQDPIMQLYCSLDGATEVACPGDGIGVIDYSAAGIAPGSHSLVVRGRGMFASTTLAPVSFDVVANPSVSIGGVAEGERLASPVGHSLTITSNGGPIVSQSCSLSVDGSVVSTSCSSPIALDSLPAGNAQLTVESIGKPGTAQTTATRNFVIGGAVKLSNVNVTKLPTMSMEATFTVENADQVRCYIFDGNGTLIRANNCEGGYFSTQFYPRTTNTYSFEIVATNASGTSSDSFQKTLDYSPVTVTFPGSTMWETVAAGDFDIPVVVSGGDVAQGVCTAGATNQPERSIPCTSQTVHFTNTVNGYAYVVMQVQDYAGDWQYTYIYKSVHEPDSHIVLDSPAYGAIVAPDSDIAIKWHNDGGSFALLQCRAQFPGQTDSDPSGRMPLVPCGTDATGKAGTITREDLKLPVGFQGYVNFYFEVYSANGAAPTQTWGFFGVGDEATVTIDDANVTAGNNQFSVPFTTQNTNAVWCNFYNDETGQMLGQTSPCSSPFVRTGLPGGVRYRIEIYGNGTLNQGMDSAVVDVPLNLPTVTFTGGVGENELIRNNAASVTFDVQNSTQQVTCQVDELLQVPCDGSFKTSDGKFGQSYSPQTLGNLLGTGTHTITVRAKNQDGTRTAVRTFKIDQQLVITSNPATGPAFSQLNYYYPNGYFLAPAGQTYLEKQKFVREYADGSTLYAAIYTDAGYTSYNNGQTDYTSKAGVAFVKLLPNLLPDPAYGVNGVKKVPFTRPTGGGGYSLFVEKGHIYVATLQYREVADNVNYAFYLDRYLDTAQRDDAFGSVYADVPQSFNDAGNVMLPYPTSLTESGNDIYVTAETTQLAKMYHDSQGVVFHIIDGVGGAQIDTAYGTAGVSYLPAPQQCTLNDPDNNERERYTPTQTLKLADGKLLVGGYSYGFNCNIVSSVYRLNADGSIDSTFGTNGVVDTGIGIHAIVYNMAMVGDKIRVAANYSLSGTYIISLNADGSHDTSFNPSPGSGSSTWYKFVLSTQDSYGLGAEEITRQADGSYLIIGKLSPFGPGGLGYKSAVGRLDANGDAITSFGENGIVVLAKNEPTDMPLASDTLAAARGENSYYYSAGLLSDGRVVMAGMNQSTNQMAIRRLDSSGQEG